MEFLVLLILVILVVLVMLVLMVLRKVHRCCCDSTCKNFPGKRCCGHCPHVWMECCTCDNTNREKVEDKKKEKEE